MESTYLAFTWEKYHSLALKLASSVLSQPNKPEQIVAISRGGLTLGHLLSDFLRIPLAPITIQSYMDIRRQGRLALTQKPINPIRKSGRTSTRPKRPNGSSSPMK